MNNVGNTPLESASILRTSPFSDDISQISSVGSQGIIGSDPLDQIERCGNRALIWVGSDCFREVGRYTQHILELSQYGAFGKFRHVDKMVGYMNYIGSNLKIRKKTADFVIITSWKNAKACSDGVSEINCADALVSLLIIVCDNEKSMSKAELWLNSLPLRLSARILLSINIDVAYHVLVVWKHTHN